MVQHQKISMHSNHKHSRTGSYYFSVLSVPSLLQLTAVLEVGRKWRCSLMKGDCSLLLFGLGFSFLQVRQWSVWKREVNCLRKHLAFAKAIVEREHQNTSKAAFWSLKAAENSYPIWDQPWEFLCSFFLLLRMENIPIAFTECNDKVNEWGTKFLVGCHPANVLGVHLGMTCL